VRDSLAPFCSVVDTSSSDILWIRLLHPALTSPLFFAVVYIPPSTSPGSPEVDPAERFALFRASVERFLPLGPVVIAGDFNAYTASLDDRVPPPFPLTDPAPPRRSLDTATNAYGTQLLSICADLGLLLLNGRTPGDIPGSLTTRLHTVDYFLCSSSILSAFSSLSIQSQPGFSDHALLTTSFLPPFSSALSASSLPQRSRFRKKLHPDFDFASACETAFSCPLFVSSLSSGTVDSATTTFTSTFSTLLASAYGRAIRSSRPRRLPSQPWFTPALAAQKAALSTAHPSLLPDLRRSFLNACRSARRAYEHSHAVDLVTSLKSNPQRFWRSFSAVDRPRVPLTPTQLHAHFSSLFAAPLGDTPEPPPFTSARSFSTSSSAFLSSPFSPAEVEECLNRMKTGKAADLSGFTVEHLLAALPHVLEPLVILFNRMFFESFPISEASAYLIPLLKKGDPADPNNYRGISIISLLSKVFATLLERRLSSACETCGLRAKGQAGFRTGHRTTDQIFILNHLADQAQTTSESPLFCCFVDFEKAFDKVPRCHLWARLRDLKCPPVFLSALENYYAHVRFCVDTPEGLTDFFPSALGVKQGCPLSPTLFGLYIDYLEEYLDTYEDLPSDYKSLLCRLLFFADDLALLARSQQVLQALLDVLADFCDLTGLRVNVSKTKYMVFHHPTESYPLSLEHFIRKKINGKKPKLSYARLEYSLYLEDIPSVCLRYRGRTVERVSSFRYLGFEFHSTLTASYGAAQLLKSASRAMYALLRLLRRHSITSLSASFDLFHTLVVPIALYASEVWLPYDWSSGSWRNLPLETLHRSFLRRVSGLPHNTPNETLMWELGRYPLYSNALSRFLKYYDHLVSADSSTYLSRALHAAKSERYASLVSDLIRSYSPSFSFLSSAPSLTTVTDKYKDRFRAALTDTFHENFSSHRLYSTYWLTNPVFGYALRLEEHIPSLLFFHRASLLRFHTATHNCPINTGTYYNIARVARYCPSCSLRGTLVVGSEVHYLHDCPAIAQLRASYPNIPFTAALADLFSIELEPTVLRSLGHFFTKLSSHLAAMGPQAKAL
jgi:hypothetical protein